MPLYRLNVAGQSCTEPGKPLEEEGEVIQILFIVVATTWVLSCCTACAFNKNDFKLQFSYETHGRNDVGDNMSSQYTWENE